MRRVLGLLAAIVLAGSLATSSAAAEPVGQPDSFVGRFDILNSSGDVVANINAEVRRPDDQHRVPGRFDLYGPTSEVHVWFGTVGFWYDANHEGGSNVVLAEGAGCRYGYNGDIYCGAYAQMFIDVLDPAKPDQNAFATVRDDNGEWIFTENHWYDVGNGSFVLHYNEG